MRLPGLCLALLCALAGTGSPGRDRELPPCTGTGRGTAAGRAAGLGRGEPGGGRGPRAGGVDPRQAWMLLAGSAGRTDGNRGRGRTGTGRAGTTAPAPGQSSGNSPEVASEIGVPGAPAALEELLRELQLLLKGMVKEQEKTCRKAWEGPGEKEESKGGNRQAGSHRRVEAAFHCQTRENISVEKRVPQELQLYYIVSAQPASPPCLQHLAARGIHLPGSLTQASFHPQPQREVIFHRGSGLNLTSGQYTAPVSGYYTFTAKLHIVCRAQRRKGHPQQGNRLRVLICVQSSCQHNSNLETVSRLESGGDLFTISVTGVLYLQRRSAGGVKRLGAPRRELNLDQKQPNPSLCQPPDLPCSAPSTGNTFCCCSRSCRLF
ncbi:erythroferrone [Phaethornis superciliosus]